MNTDSKTGEKRKAQSNNRQGNNQGQWANKKNQKKENSCERCSRNHELKNCPWTTGSCFQCGEKGHLIANCPKKPPQKQNQEGQKKKGEGQGQQQKTQGKLYNMTREDADNASDTVRGSEENPLY